MALFHINMYIKYNTHTQARNAGTAPYEPEHWSGADSRLRPFAGLERGHSFVRIGFFHITASRCPYALERCFCYCSSLGRCFSQTTGLRFVRGAAHLCKSTGPRGSSTGIGHLYYCNLHFLNNYFERKYNLYI